MSLRIGLYTLAHHFHLHFPETLAFKKTKKPPSKTKFPLNWVSVLVNQMDLLPGRMKAENENGAHLFHQSLHLLFILYCRIYSLNERLADFSRLLNEQ